MESNLVASIRSSGQRLECAYWRIAHDDFTPLTTEISEVYSSLPSFINRFVLVKARSPQERRIVFCNRTGLKNQNKSARGKTFRRGDSARTTSCTARSRSVRGLHLRVSLCPSIAPRPILTHLVMTCPRLCPCVHRFASVSQLGESTSREGYHLQVSIKR